MGRSKPSAAARTVDLFSKKTDLEQSAEAERIRAGEDLAGAKGKKPISIEEAAEKYRANAFTGQEWTTELFGRPEAEDNQYRVTRKNGYLYLERTGATKGSAGAFSYAGVMFPEGDIIKLANVIVSAARAYKEGRK